VAADSIDPKHFRQVLGYFPTGVTVITACTADNEPIGFTIGSFASVSLDPLLVGFLPMVTSERWATIREAGTFCVNVLGADQGELCWQFAKTDAVAPFEGVEWRPSNATGSPIIAGSIAWIDCSIEKIIEAGDHQFVIGRVLQLDHAPPEESPNALIFFRGQLGSFLGHD
jgi:flavin reductase (DIM6/NTAB) family NADH-FMN oxidoreductase RutF